MTDDAAGNACRSGWKYEQDYGGCSQCVIAALQDAFGIQNDAVFKAATGLAAGGGGYTDGSCGAYAGALMMLGLLRGRARGDFPDAMQMAGSFALAGRLRERFIREYGSVICRDIQTKIFGRPYYLADPEEFQKFEKAGAHQDHCPGVVGRAARWAAELIIEENLARNDR
jgi:C_GCAxxG_C_C family probable redox protein